MHSIESEGQIDNKSTVEQLDPEGEFIRVKIACPNCARVAKVIKIRSNEPKELKNIHCKKCPIEGFDWMYEPAQLVDGRYLYINTLASLPASNMAKFIVFSNKNNYFSNK